MTRFFILLAAVLYGAAASAQATFKPTIPKVWDEAALSDWATPVAGLNVRPAHIPAKEYYSLPVDNRRTYPVYYPGREPEGSRPEGTAHAVSAQMPGGFGNR